MTKFKISRRSWGKEESDLGVIKNGSVHLVDRNKFDALLKANDGQQCEVIVRIVSKRDKRSDQQNRYYWGVVIPHLKAGLEEAYGKSVSSDQAHHFAANNWNFEEFIVTDTGTGEIITTRTPLSSTWMDTKQFSEYVESIRNFAREYLNTEIPEADEPAQH